MTKIHPEHMTANIEGNFVVFLIGMRINTYWRIQKWFPPFLAMQSMLTELKDTPSEHTGYLGHTILGFGVIVQYWRSFEHLDAYANAPDYKHFPAWVAFNKRMKGAAGAIGVWHETYLVQAGQYENVYIGMPAYGMGAAGRLEQTTALNRRARDRLKPT